MQNTIMIRKIDMIAVNSDSDISRLRSETTETENR